MKPKKGMTAKVIVEKLEDERDYYKEMRDHHLANHNDAGYQVCSCKLLYIEVLLSEIAE